MDFRYEERSNGNEHGGGGILTLDVFAISWDCFDLKSSDYSLKGSGHCLPFKVITCSITGCIGPCKDQTQDKNNTKQSSHQTRDSL